LTVHKSKGLQYPCVIFPKFSTNSPAQNLWIEAPRNTLSFQAGLVRYSPTKDRKEDRLSEEQEEFSKMFLDEMNLLYVATTRAEDALFLLVEGGKTNSSLHSLLLQELSSWKTERNSSEFGELQKREAKKQDDALLPIQRLTGTRKNRLQVQYRFREILKKEKEEREYIQLGTDFHECIASIKKSDDLERALFHFLQSKSDWDTLKKEEFESSLRTFVTNSPFSHIFQTEALVYTEQEIVVSPSKIIRPDRIHVFPDRVEIFDFKTGTSEDAQKKYGSQLKGYLRAVEEVFNLPTRAFVIMQKTGSLVEIVN
jgi:ATP-dependent exoDNAse (exonuclease V) beta subunit